MRFIHNPSILPRSPQFPEISPNPVKIAGDSLSNCPLSPSSPVNASLEQQLQTLTQSAPQDGQTPRLIEAISPILLELAKQLQHLDYYILQDIDGRWMMTQLSHREEQQPEKTVVYAYATLEDARCHPQMKKDNTLMAIPTPVMVILFQLLALQPVTSLLFFDTPGNRHQALEIRRDDMQTLVKAQLSAYQQAQAQSPIPPDLA